MINAQGCIFILILLFLIIVVDLICKSISDVVREKDIKHAKNKQDQEKRFKELDLVLQDDIYERIIGLIDSFIRVAIDSYLGLQAFDSEYYLDSETMKEMQQYVTASVIRNITDPVRDAIALVYKYDTDERLMELIKLRIKIALIIIKTENNKPLQDHLITLQ